MRTLEDAAREASGCTQVVYGVGNPHADLMFIGEGPGFYEDKQGEPFVGAAGQLLNRMLGEIGFQREDAYIANVVMCRPPGNRDPMPDEIDACTPWLMEKLELIDPRIVVTLGNFATRFILDTTSSISRLRGQRFRWRERTVIPTFHPAAVLHGGGENSRQMQSLREDFREIKAALDEKRGPAVVPGRAVGVDPAGNVIRLPEAESPSEQLGLF
jgi:uracil-DNA glycosylase family 4